MRRQLRHVPGAVLLVLLAASYAPVIAELIRDWIRDSNYHHGFLIPIVSGYLLWRGRGAWRRLVPAPSLLGLPALLAAGALLVVGTAGAEVFTQRVSLVVLLGALVLWLRGWRALGAVAFPLAFLLLAIPMPYVIYYSLTGPLQALATKLAVGGLTGVGVPVLAQGNVIHLPQGSLEVVEACSGIRSLYAFLAVGALVAHTTPVPWWARLAIFSLTIPLSVAGNALRVWGTGLELYLIGPQATEGTAHELFGVFVFVVSLVFFLIVRSIARRLWSPVTSSPSWPSGSPAPGPARFAPSSPPPGQSPRSPSSPVS